MSRTETEVQRWPVGEATITSIVEDETHHIPPSLFFPGVENTQVQAYPELVPDYADEAGNVALRVQALVVEVANRMVMVDPCVGNGKVRPFPFWNQQNWPFMERFAAAGFSPEHIDTVVHTHLHADHVGWDTHLDGDSWVPTFANARHLYTAPELDFCRAGGDPGIEGVYGDSVGPIVDAGLADIVAEDADLGDGLALQPSPGHTPGHVSLWIRSGGETALVSGDFLHHPVQCQELAWAEAGDADAEQARATRRAMLARAADADALFVGTHFSVRPAGRITTDGDAFRFEPLPG